MEGVKTYFCGFCDPKVCWEDVPLGPLVFLIEAPKHRQLLCMCGTPRKPEASNNCQSFHHAGKLSLLNAGNPLRLSPNCQDRFPPWGVAWSFHPGLETGLCCFFFFNLSLFICSTQLLQSFGRPGLACALQALGVVLGGPVPSEVPFRV